MGSMEPRQIIGGFGVTDQSGERFLLLAQFADKWAAGFFAEKMKQRCLGERQITFLGSALQLPKEWFRGFTTAKVAKDLTEAEALALNSEDDQVDSEKVTNEGPEEPCLKAG